MLNQGVDKTWEFSLKLFGLGVSKDTVEFEFDDHDLKLNIKRIQLLFFSRVIIKFRKIERPLNRRYLPISH
jgi:hypothetical protein